MLNINYFKAIQNAVGNKHLKDTKVNETIKQFEDRFDSSINVEYDVTRNDVQQTFIITPKTDDKNKCDIVTRPNEELNIGDIIYWHKLHWIVTDKEFDNSIYNIGEQSYIDGQAVLHCTVNDDKKGIQSVEMIDPAYLFYDREKECYVYERGNYTKSLYALTNLEDEKLKYSRDEIVRSDFGLYEKNICLSYVEFGIKNANILKNLEDLLVPLRFSRSMTRRVFNVDVGNLPAKRVDEVMKIIQQRFQYKKFYNSETGEINNQQHITSMAEDYWFPNRSGSKGTQVDVLDETGNLGELGDILYYARKLYRSMNVPVSRLHLDNEADHTFDYESTQTSKEDIKFFTFISRIRQVYSDLFKKLLKLEVISSGILNEKEWQEREHDIKVVFNNENKFIEKMRLMNLQEALDIYNSASEQVGKVFTVRYLLKEIFKKSDDEIDELLKDLESEKNDKRFSAYYGSSEEF